MTLLTHLQLNYANPKARSMNRANSKLLTL